MQTFVRMKLIISLHFSKLLHYEQRHITVHLSIIINGFIMLAMVK
jgi:hypothetical protein